MSVENAKVVDIVGISKSGNTVLTISDHLEWDDANEHLLLLQDKINAYLATIESGEIYENYPDAKGRFVVIEIILKYVSNDDGKKFLKKVKELLIDAGYGFDYKNL